jgi:hypothetical protein
MKTLLALLVATSCTLANAFPVVSGHVVSGHVSSRPAEEPSAPRVSGACFWEVPGFIRFVNLNAMVMLTVLREGDGYVTRLHFGRYEDLDIAIPKGESLTMHTRQIVARLAACKAGD